MEVGRLLDRPPADRGLLIGAGLPALAVPGIDRFGMSAPGAEVMKELGITAEHVVEVARRLPA